MNIIVLFACVFLMSFRESKQTACDHQLNATTHWKVFRSPGFPATFPSQVHCSWRFATLPSFRVKIQFTNLRLVKPDPFSGVCRLQWINIVDGDPVLQEKGVRICGISSPGTLVSSGNVITISLRSKVLYQRFDYAGFEGAYRMTNDFPHNPVKPVSKHSSPKIPPRIHGNSNQQHSFRHLSNYNPLNYDNPNKLNAGQSQSNTIEELNDQRNKGAFVSNPIFGGARTTTSTRSAASISNEGSEDLRPKSSSNAFDKWNAVLIITAVFFVCLLSIFFLYKRRREKLRIASELKTKNNHCKDSCTKRIYLSNNLTNDRNDEKKTKQVTVDPNKQDGAKVVTVSEKIDRSKLKQTQKNKHFQQSHAKTINYASKSYGELEIDDAKRLAKKKIRSLNSCAKNKSNDNRAKNRHDQRKEYNRRLQSPVPRPCESDSKPVNSRKPSRQAVVKH